MSVDIDRRPVSMHDFFIHAHERAARKGLFPRFELLSHVRAEHITLKNGIFLGLCHFSKVSEVEGNWQNSVVVYAVFILSKQRTIFKR
jgi:hypothetical protein